MRPLLPAMLLALFASSLTSAQETRDAVVLSGKYSDLHPEQRRLVDDWFRRFSEVVKKEVSPEDGYNNVPISSKTTFSAITHALLRTTLTDESGKSLGDSAMVLIERIDHLFGTVPGERGDKQFRIYVSLRPGALDILERSKEFERTADNTVYHKGFPICFRGGGGTPSIQVSISKDGKLADIDVDYRSSKFPVALFNGHLSSSNSDIRAGNNDERHNNRWAGVSNWWRSLLGLPLAAIQPLRARSASVATTSLDVPALASDPGNPELIRASRDFFQKWFVRRRVNEAFQYMSPRAYSCANLYRDADTPEAKTPA